jgi:hypothetical protein
LANRAGEPGIRRGKFDDIHTGERRAPGKNPVRINVGVRRCPANDGAVIFKLARKGKLLAGLPGRAAPLAVVEYDCGKTLTMQVFWLPISR